MRGLAAVAKVSPVSCGEALPWPVGISSGLALLCVGSQRYISPSQVQSILIIRVEKEYLRLYCPFWSLKRRYSAQ